MKKLLKTSPYLIIAILVGVTVTYATSKITPPEAVTNTMYSLTDVYNLSTGTTTTEGTGTIETTPALSETGKTLTEVYTAISSEIAKLSSSVIASGTTAFGVTGDTSVVNTASGDATVSDIMSGKKAWVDGVEIIGEAVAGVPDPVFAIADASPGNVSWDGANNACSSYSESGYPAGSWRVPTSSELIKYLLSNNGTPPGFQADVYWSGSTSITNSSNAYFVNMVNGYSWVDGKIYFNYKVHCAR